MVTRVRRFLQQASTAAIDLLFPPPIPCALCRGPVSTSSEVGICTTCLDRIGRIGEGRCDRCGRALVRHPREGSKPVFCRQCETSPPLIDHGRAYGVYQGYLRSCIHSLKYSGDLLVARGLGQLMAWLVAVDPGFSGVQVIVPVPLHPKRQRERGYNQAFELAKAVGGALGLPVVQAVVKTRQTPPQSSLSWRERLQNARGAFEAVILDRVRGKTALVVDDVYTTGATASAVALALKRAGSPRVCGIFAAAGSLDQDFVVTLGRRFDSQ